MAAYASGTQSATVTTEHTLTDVNVAGTYTLHVDTVNMVANDVLELRVYQMTLTAGTHRMLYTGRFYGAQPVDDIIKVSLPIQNDLTDSISLRFSLKQTFGTSRNFPWKVLKDQQPILDAAVSLSQINAEVVDALNTDTYAEPGQGTPAATTTLVAKIGYLYKAWRNRHTQTASEYALYGDDATTKDQEAVVSDNGTTFDRGEVSTGA